MNLATPVSLDKSGTIQHVPYCDLSPSLSVGLQVSSTLCHLLAFPPPLKLNDNLLYVCITCSFFILWWMWLCTAPIFGLLGIMVLGIWGYKYPYFTPLSNIPNGIAGSYCYSNFSPLFFFLPFSYSWRSPRDTVMLHSSPVLSWSSVRPLLETAGDWLPSMIRAQALHNAQGSICIAGHLQVGWQLVLANAVMWQDTALCPLLLQCTDIYGSIWTPGLILSSRVFFSYGSWSYL